ncbi:SCO3374 family protein [Streptomyces sp. SudanB66_2053]|uniref:SCO3374 family protein n=1 Tax=Streptomyces TaxID=1883 RepID=UPI003F575541
MAGTRSAALPSPRRPGASAREESEGRHGDRTRLWYENVLGWPTVPGVPPRLVVGARFDVLDVPAEAGHASLERLGGAATGFPVALQRGRMRLLVAAGGADELPGLLEWLEWGGLGLDLRALGEGCRMDAPAPWTGGTAAGAGLPRGRPDAGRPGEEGPHGRDGSQGAAVWLRPPEPGREAETSLPTLSAMGTRSPRGDGDGPPDLVRLVSTLATQIHRVRLRRSGAGAAVHGLDQPLAFS